MSDDQFTKLFKYMQQRFDALEAKLDTKADAEKLDRLYNAVDGIAKRLDTEEGERAAIVRQLGRHRGWIEDLATKTGLQLSHD